MNTEFWLLESPETNTRIIATSPYRRITCAAGHLSVRQSNFGELSVKLPVRSLTDFESTWDSRVVISERALQALKGNNVTGFEVRPVEAQYDTPTDIEPPPLFELAVTGWGGMAAPDAGIHLIASCRACQHREYRIADPTRIVDPATWDGSDLFMIWPLPAYPFVSNRLARILRRERLSGVELLPASRIDLKPGDRLTPGPLGTFMPENRALEIGRDFDVLDG
jgi:hypothetical protein